VIAPGSTTSDQECEPVSAPQPNVLWLDASARSTIVKDGSGLVSEWRDRSGKNRHATVPEGSDRPRWREGSGPAGSDELEFNGDKVRLQTAAVPTSPEMTVFVVFNWTSPQTWGSLLNQGQDTFHSIRQSDACCGGNGYLNWHVRSRNDAPLLPPRFGAYQLLTTMQSGGTASMYYDSSHGSSASEPNISAGSEPITIGNANAAAQSMGGTLVEIRAYDYALTSAQRHAVEAELKAKYKLGYTSCDDILSHNPAAADGRYTIDPDGDGAKDPITVTCDMTEMDGGWAVVSSDDFSNGAAGWSPSIVSRCGKHVDILGGVGMFGKDIVASKTFDLGGLAHTHVRVQMKFIKIGEWEFEDGLVIVDDENPFEQTFDGGDGLDSQCGTAAPEWDVAVNEMRPHTSNNVTVRVSTTLNSDDDDESFAIDDVVISVQ
jgi:hypothetical protein